MEKRITSTLQPEFRDDGEGSGTITGYAAVFYRADDPGTQYQLWPGAVERILPGAFDRAVLEDDVVALFNHDPNQVLGRAKAGTLKLTVDNTGLRYEITPGETTVFQDLQKSLKRKDISGSSFAFRIDSGGEEWRKEGETEVREVSRVRLYDVGPVTFPAYTSTTAQGRSDMPDTLDTMEAIDSHLIWKVEREADHHRREARLREIELAGIRLTE